MTTGRGATTERHFWNPKTERLPRNELRGLLEPLVGQVGPLRQVGLGAVRLHAGLLGGIESAQERLGGRRRGVGGAGRAGASGRPS